MSVSIVTLTLAPPVPHDKAASRSFYYGDEQITFHRMDRTTASQKILVKVLPDCRVVVHAPDAASDVQVLAAVRKRGRWIYQRLKEFQAQLTHVTPRRFISGESHHYLGKRYLLKVIVSEKEQVKLLRGKLEVSVRSRDRVPQVLSTWYRERAKEVFTRRLVALLPQTLWLTGSPMLRVQAMSSQWGSCSPRGRLTLNPWLVKAPGVCIDYVLLHELCHIVEHNHSKRFYKLLQQVMPEWTEVKAKLDNMAQVYLNGSERQVR
jgi:predicted metal-dependent hydrolase